MFPAAFVIYHAIAQRIHAEKGQCSSVGLIFHLSTYCLSSSVPLLTNRQTWSQTEMSKKTCLLIYFLFGGFFFFKQHNYYISFVADDQFWSLPLIKLVRSNIYLLCSPYHHNHHHLWINWGSWREVYKGQFMCSNRHTRCACIHEQRNHSAS